MGKVSKNKMVLKQCPICDYQVPVACKLCRCGHGFFNKRLMQPKESGDEDTNGVKRRRTERVRRERPDYYSASEFENHLRRISTSSKSGDKGEEKVKKQRRGRPKGSQTKNKDGASADQKEKEEKEKEEKEKEKEKEKEEDLYANIPTDKAFQYAVVLAEINEKMQNQTWKQPVCQEGTISSPEGNAVVTT